MRLSHLLPLVPLFTYAPKVVAWGAAGHEITATIAQMYLFDSTRSALCSILPAYANCHLAPIAAWADKIKWLMRWSSQLHYVNGIGDHPGNHCVFGHQGWQGTPGVNVLGGIRNTSTWLHEGKDGAEEALKFLVHFMGDLHMPLHLTGRSKGGNGGEHGLIMLNAADATRHPDKVRWDGRQQKFHAVWDGLIIAKAIRTVPYNYTAPLPNAHVEATLRGDIYDPYIRQIVWEGLLDQWSDDLVEWTHCPLTPVTPTQMQGQQVPLGVEQPPTDNAHVCPYFWATPIHALNCEIVWPPELDEDDHDIIELDTPEYAGKLYKDRVVERLLAMAGIRTAAILNMIFGDPDEMGSLAVSWTAKSTL